MHILYTRSIHGTKLEEEIILTGGGSKMQAYVTKKPYEQEHKQAGGWRGRYFMTLSVRGRIAMKQQRGGRQELSQQPRGSLTSVPRTNRTVRSFR